MIDYDSTINYPISKKYKIGWLGLKKKHLKILTDKEHCPLLRYALG